MKKLGLIVALAGGVSLSYGQGYVGVANDTASKVSADGAAIRGGTNTGYYFEVLIAPTTVTRINVDDPLSGGWTDSTIELANSTANGRVVGINDNYDPYGGGAQIPSGFPTYGTANFAVVGWSADLGPTLADALDAWNGGGWLIGVAGNDPGLVPGATSAFMGISGVALDIVGAPAGGPYNNIWGLASDGEIPGMELYLPPIPEPGTIALGGLGAAAVVVFRWRKKYKGFEVIHHEMTRTGSRGRAKAEGGEFLHQAHGTRRRGKGTI